MTNNFEKRVNKYSKEINSLAKDLQLQVMPIVNFKKGKITWVGRIAVYLLVKSGGYLDTQFTNLKK